MVGAARVRAKPIWSKKLSSLVEGVFRRKVYDDPITNVELDQLRRHCLRAWRKRLEEAPALLTRGKQCEKRWKERSKPTLNRVMVRLRAALWRAWCAKHRCRMAGRA